MDYAPIANGHNGLNWSNFFTVDTSIYGPSGYINGVVSMDNFTFNQQPQPAPEPSTMLLLGSGVLGLVAARRYMKS